jgi:hypothetical protein
VPVFNGFFSRTTKKLLVGEAVLIPKMSDLPPEAGRDRESYTLYGTKSTFICPLAVGREPVFGALSFAVMREERDWPETVVMGLLS